ncbi:uncharacterized protein LOC143000816 [Genypterus blacodes]|uniref:uncharacterized protein LOC143000816 n=1 Tax=Genypterus blacodes TaxID=154954 RepID=UPI003F767BD9
MADKSKRKAISFMLENLDAKDLKCFYVQLRNRKEEPRVPRNKVEGKDYLDITDVLVSTFTEDGAVREAERILRKLCLNDEADDLVKETGGQSSAPGSSDAVGSSCGAAGSLFPEEAGRTREKLRRTLRCFSEEELKTFNWFLIGGFEHKKRFLHLRWSTDEEDTVVQMMRTFGPQSVNVAEEILIKMKRHDLVQMLSDTSSGSKDESGGTTSVQGKQSTVEFPSADKVSNEEARRTREKLRRTLRCLSTEELNAFNWFQIGGLKHPRRIQRSRDVEDTVAEMMRTFGPQSVNVAEEILIKMKRHDLVQMLSDTSSGSKDESGGTTSVQGKQSTVEFPSADKVSNEEARRTREKLRRIVRCLRQEELNTFNWFLTGRFKHPRRIQHSQWSTDEEDTVVQMMRTFGPQSVNVAEEILIKIKRHDLVQMLSDTSSGSKDESGGTTSVQAVGSSSGAAGSLFPEEARRTREKLRRTLRCLGQEELKTFNWFLIVRLKHSGQIQHSRWSTDKEDTVYQMMRTFGPQSVNVAEEVLMKMKRQVLVQMLSDTSSGSKDESGGTTSVQGKQSTVEFPSADKEEARNSREKLRRIVSCFSEEELKTFNWFLIGGLEHNKRFLHFRWSRDVKDTVAEMMRTFGPQSVNVAEEILIKMKRHDPVQMLSDTSSGSKDESGGTTSVQGKQSTVEFPSADKVSNEEARRTREKLRRIVRCLSEEELNTFNWFLIGGLERNKRFLHLRWSTDEEDTVAEMMRTFGPQSVNVAEEILIKMKRHDLVQMLSDTSSGSKGESGGTTSVQAGGSSSGAAGSLFPEEARRTSEEKLRRTLWCLSEEELNTFNWFLIEGLKSLGYMRHLEWSTDVEDTVYQMMRTFGPQSVNVAEEILIKMKKHDLVQMLSDTSSGSKGESGGTASVQAVGSSSGAAGSLFPIYQEETRRTSEEKLRRTLRCFSEEELKTFNWFLIGRLKHPGQIQHLQWSTDEEDTVAEMMETFGPQSVNVAEEILIKMKRHDLVQMLSDTSSGSKDESGGTTSVQGKQSTVEFPSADKEEARRTRKKLRRTLRCLSTEELNTFNWFMIGGLKHPRRIQRSRDEEDTVAQMMRTFGPQSVNVAEEILIMMKRHDLVQMLSDTSSGSKDESGGTTSVQAVGSSSGAAGSLFPEEAGRTREKLRRTLRCFSEEELKTFNWFLIGGLEHNKRFLHLRWSRDVDHTVDQMMRTFGPQSVNVAEEILIKMKRHDLVQMLSDTSSGSKGESGGTTSVQAVGSSSGAAGSLFPEEARRTREKLRRTLRCLSEEELNTFNWFLIARLKHSGQIQHLRWSRDVEDTVAQMMRIFGPQSVNVAEEILIKMKRHDLVQMLSDTSSGPKDESGGTTSVQAVGSSSGAAGSLFPEEAGRTREKLRRTLRCLSTEELKTFNWFLIGGLKCLGYMQHLKWSTDVEGTVAEMMESFGPQSVNVAEEILIKMKRHDLVQMLSDTSSGPKDESGGTTSVQGPEESPEACGSVVQKSALWTKVQPEVSSVDQTTTYSLQSEAGHFECSVSGFRWVCHERVTIKYHLNTWLEHRERLAGTGYTPAGPLLDITITDGKFEEVYLPHWICIAAVGSSPGAAGGSSPGAAGGSSPGAAGGSSSGAAGGSSSGAAGPPPTVQEVEDFLKKNEEVLIQRVNKINVKQILDSLKTKEVINSECYDTIKDTLKSSQDQMREIFRVINSQEGKMKFYKILLEKEPLLMKELKTKM